MPEIIDSAKGSNRNFVLNVSNNVAKPNKFLNKYNGPPKISNYGNKKAMHSNRHRKYDKHQYDQFVLERDMRNSQLPNPF